MPSNPNSRVIFRRLLAALMVLLGVSRAAAQLPVYGDYYAHDPSRMIKQGNTYYIYRTSQGIMGKTSTDLRNWTYSGQVFPGNPPAWTTNAVPGFTGFFWAPDIVFLNGTYYLYYAVSGFGLQVSSIGLVTCTNLSTGHWTDQGEVIHSTTGDAYNCIDPCPLIDTNGTMWMTFGSYWNGIYLVQLDPTTGKRITPNSPLINLAYNSSIEGSFLCQRGGYYYLFVNWDTCCSGIDSTYNIRVGRSTSVTGPYLDRNSVNMVSSGGSMFLESTARFIGPGQAGIMNDNGTNWLTYHYYDGNNAGTATLGLGQLTWSADGWPVFTNDWSAFYTFNTNAREHLALYNGALQNGAVIANEPGRGNVLSLDGISQYVLLPDPVANASTFAAWVKWNGGADWQRIFDFGNGTTPYFFLTPRAGSTGRLRFAITTSGNGAEQTIDAPTALPTNSWCHVAVTLDGAEGLLYLNGIPVATNNNLTIRPWQTLARTNYIGKSQFATDPMFSGEIGSFRIFGRALGGAEIKDLAYAQPALAHRYSFTSNTSNVWDSIGMAHGMLMGNARITNNALNLTGASGDYVNLPGGLVSGSSAATIEFWATFGVNGNWARVFSFGNISGLAGQNFLSFSPHTVSNTVQLGLATTRGTLNLTSPETFDNLALHVVCITDPANDYSAIYTNGILLCAITNATPPLNSVSPAWSFIGRSLFGTDAWLNATVDEFRIYDGRLTPEEIAANDRFGPNVLALPISLGVSAVASNIALTWPSYAVDFTAESSPTLGANALWSPVSGLPTLGNNQWRLTLPATNNTTFIRLIR